MNLGNKDKRITLKVYFYDFYQIFITRNHYIIKIIALFNTDVIFLKQFNAYLD
jgi:hypothetical protein